MKPACPAPGEQISVSFSTVDLGAYIDRTAKRNPWTEIGLVARVKRAAGG
jgi:hypothetical protein